ncbi:MAG: thioredoxin family protein [Streptosporangiaceae bacterium]
MTPGLAALVAALALALVGGAIWRKSNGRFKGMPDEPYEGDDPGADSRLSAEQLGHPLGERATLVQFSSAFCAPCRATRRILTDVAAMTEGVTYVEIDAESHLDLVRELNVLRTPTVLVLAADGRIVSRGSGQPRKPDAIAALGLAVQEAIPTYKIGKQDSDISSQHA